MFVCKGRMCQGQGVSGNTFIHGNRGSGEKNKQGEKFQGNWGKTRTKESGEKGSSQAKGKQMEETLEPLGPCPCGKELDRRPPLLVWLFLGQQCHLLLSNCNIQVGLLTEEMRPENWSSRTRYDGTEMLKHCFRGTLCHLLQLLFSSLGQTQQPQGPIPATPGWWIRAKGSLQGGSGVLISSSNSQIWDFALIGNPKHQSDKNKGNFQSLYSTCVLPKVNRWYSWRILNSAYPQCQVLSQETPWGF